MSLNDANLQLCLDDARTSFVRLRDRQEETREDGVSSSLLRVRLNQRVSEVTSRGKSYPEHRRVNVAPYRPSRVAFDQIVGGGTYPGL